VVDDLLDHMLDQGLENSITYGLAIDGFCRGGHLSKAEKIFNKVGKRLDNVEVLYNAMVRGYLHSGSTDDAYKLFPGVAQQANLLDRSCSKLINNLCRDENVKKASTVFR